MPVDISAGGLEYGPSQPCCGLRALPATWWSAPGERVHHCRKAAVPTIRWLNYVLMAAPGKKNLCAYAPSRIARREGNYGFP